ncbi:aldolase/citrate lyase family protein [Saxibacter everestensis]|uniref:Aldolase/citrate lyase family protein n=1 Tax=Saxibacter everestensis TaxID=2909229 RepID=A0ABY8QUR1_9MICO|nr:aldolase/citrate lyase family protein [Brevibacteriaceae bacterium ZFBP1038]
MSEPPQARRSVREKLAAGEPILGTFVMEFATNGIGRLTDGAGADFVLYDGEHTGWSWETLAGLLATTRHTGLASWVRVPGHDPSFISRALDIGAQGVMVPFVNTPEQATRLASAAKYPPVGTRGAAFGIAHDDYIAGAIDDKISTANRDGLLIAQIESEQGVHNAAGIAAVDGVDVLFVGPLDLSISLGIPGQFDDERFIQALTTVAHAALGQGKGLGILTTSTRMAETALGLGYRVIAHSADLWIYQSALRNSLERLRELHATVASRGSTAG